MFNHLANVLNISLLLQLAATATSLALPDPSLSHLTSKRAVEDYMKANNITVQYGHYNASEALAGRATNVPPECSFATPQRYEFTYYLFTDQVASGTACFGYTTFNRCGDSWWNDPDWTDAQAVANQQIAKDGHFENSKQGAWNAYFFLETSAFKTRDPTWFTLGLLYSGSDDGHFPQYFYSRDYDFMTVSRGSGGRQDCP